MSAGAPAVHWVVEDQGWYPVTDAGSVGVVRRAAESLGR